MTGAPALFIPNWMEHVPDRLLRIATQKQTGIYFLRSRKNAFRTIAAQPEGLQGGPMPKRFLKFLAFANLAIATAYAAQNPFIGEWKLNPSLTRMPDEMKVESKGNNTYSFDFGGGAETIVADGTDQPGGYGGTTLSVKADAPDTWIVERKKNSKLLLRATWKLSSDSTTLTDFYREFEPDGSTLSMDYIYQRSGAGSGFAADWQSIKETMNSPFVLEVKQYQGDGLTFINSMEHETKNVKPDGKDYPIEGSKRSSSLRRVDDHTLEMTDKRGGKLTDTRELQLSPDGKRLTMTVHPEGGSKPNVMVFDRQ
jgi:hypothetical protein